MLPYTTFVMTYLPQAYENYKDFEEHADLFKSVLEISF